MQPTTTASNVPTITFYNYVSDIIRSIHMDESVIFRNDELLNSFINKSNPDLIYILKCTDDDSFQVLNNLATIVPNQLISLTLIIKGKGILNEEVSLKSQLNIINLPINSKNVANNSIDTIKSTINLGLLPYYELTNGSNEDSSNTIKKFRELSSSLQSLSIQPPDLIISTHPKIKQLLNSNDSRIEGLNDMAFFNELTSITNDWIKQIQSITKINHKSKSLQEEIEFWNSIDSAISLIQKQMKSPEVEKTLEILNQAKRFHVILSFENDTGLNDIQKISITKNSFLKDIPMKELIDIDEEVNFSKIYGAVSDLFYHLKQKMGLLSVSDAVEMTNLLLNDSVIKFKNAYSQLKIMSVPYSKFQHVIQESFDIIQLVEENVKYISNMLRELARKKQEKVRSIIHQTNLTNLIARLSEVKQLRNNYENLKTSLSNTLQGEEKNRYISDLYEAYGTYLLSINAADFSDEAQKNWLMNESSYMKIYNSVFTYWFTKINLYFDNAKSFSDYLNIFNKFFPNRKYDSNFMPINDTYKLKFLEFALAEIQILKDSATTTINDDYEKIIIYTELTYKIQFYTENLQRILGNDWLNYSIGQKIDTITKSLLTTINSNLAFESWISKIVDLTPMKKSGVIIKVLNKDGKYNVTLNVDFSIFNTAESIYALESLGFKFPISLKLAQKKNLMLLNMAYDIADQITSFNKIFQATPEKLLNYIPDSIEDLIELILSISNITWSHLSDAIDLINQNDALLLSSENLIEIQSIRQLQKLNESLTQINAQLTDLQNFHNFIKKQYHKLQLCFYDYEVIRLIMRTIERKFEISSLGKSGFKVVQSVNDEIKLILASRLETQLKIFTNNLDPIAQKLEIVELEGYQVKFEKITHQIIIVDGSLEISPNLVDGKNQLYSIINQLMKIVAQQKYISLNRTYSDILSVEIANNACNNVVDQITICYDEAQAYLIRWKTFQTILVLDTFENLFVDDLSKSFDILKECCGYEKLLDEPEKHIGGLILIDTKQIQAKSSILYASFKKSILIEFSKLFTKEVKLFSNELLQMRSVLEKPLRFHYEVSQVIKYIGKIFDGRNKVEIWDNLLTSFSTIQNYLTKQKFEFPENWLFIDQLDLDLSKVKVLLEEKQVLILKNLEFLSASLRSEFKESTSSLVKLKEDWNISRPISGELNPAEALNLLNKFYNKHEELVSYITIISNIASELRIEDLSFNNSLKTLDDIKNLKKVWASVNSFWEDLEKLKCITWSDLEPLSLRKELNEILISIKNLPFSMRQYSAINEIQNLIKNNLNDHSTIVDLKGASLKERHWSKLFDQLGLKVNKEITLGDVWNLNLALNIQFVTEILEQARNEKTIEESLTKIEENWSETYFELFNFENKCRLVKKWEKLFDQIERDLDTINLMKKSTYSSNFERKILEIENKLNSLNMILDSWVDAQSEWIQLDGVFGNENNEVKNLLPIEYSRFMNLSFEFMTLLKRIYKFDKVIEIIQITDLQTLMVRFLKTLSTIQISLSEYLEKQRDLFPRFFFLGNEDLLELIGASNDVSRINRHIKKMFIGVGELKFDQDSHSIVGVISAEGETLQFVEKVSLIEYTMLHEWLTQLEIQIKNSLIDSFSKNYPKWSSIVENLDENKLMKLLDEVPGQLSILILQVMFTDQVENDLVKNYENNIKSVLQILPSILRTTKSTLLQKIVQNMIIEILHQLDTINQLESSDLNLIWQVQQKFYHSGRKVIMRQARCEFEYGFEYLGVTEKLAYTPLINNCYLTMTQALALKLGGSPKGPAGTGKTESIKALGHNLGKMVIVFNCDEKFEFDSMGRIFLGLCRVGAWGCFDEFNRLDDHNLSAVSTQIETIQSGLKNVEEVIQLSSRDCKVNSETALFVTMNPGYVGRNELPENLRKLFRSFWMSKPDIQIIVEVLLSSQSFNCSKELSQVIYKFFRDISLNSTEQKHYDFGLRAIKSVINLCGKLIRDSVAVDSTKESEIVLQSIEQMILPKLVSSDLKLFESLQSKYFPNIMKPHGDATTLLYQLAENLKLDGLVEGSAFMKKCLQLINIQASNHGIMLVGESGSGKSTVLKMVMRTLSSVDEVEHLPIFIDPKVMSKEHLFGKFDSLTKQWTDGLFTSHLRKIIDNARGELKKRIWIVFDGDIDPIWAENLNSVLDNNKVYTLPTGERLVLPPNVTIVFETNSSEYTTPATISRCGMIWFDESLVPLEHLHQKMMFNLMNHLSQINDENGRLIQTMRLQNQLVDQMKEILTSSLMEELFVESTKLNHIMLYSFQRASSFLEAMLKTFIDRLVSIEVTIDTLNFDFKKYAAMSIIKSLVWSFAGDCNIKEKSDFAKIVSSNNAFMFLHIPNGDILDYDISLPDCEWFDINLKVEVLDLHPHEINNPNIIVPTIDTLKHEDLIYSMLKQHTSILLCGPPGSGKTMTLLKALTKAKNLEMLALNFSKESTSKSLIDAIENSCQYVKANGKLKLRPKSTGRWLVVFCDEINLPKLDGYGSQNIISLINQMIKFNGFWRTKDMQWVTLENIQFVGACNSPKDPGRHDLSSRFLRHVSLIMVDYPGKNSLFQIYQTFNNAIFKCAPDLKPFITNTTHASIEIYEVSKSHFSSKAPHYVYSPRELTRWCKGLFNALQSDNYDDLHKFLRLWYHEGLRLFHDRLSNEDDKNWTKNLFHDNARKLFPSINLSDCFKTPIFFSDWLSLKFQSVDEHSLRTFVKERLRVYSEEENTTNLILHEDMLDHILRIDRVLKQSQGHMILIGPSSSGKSTLSKFVAWINGLKVVQLNVRTGYTIDTFDDTLRQLLLRCADGEKICLLIDESSIVEASFVERMNILLANAEIPGLFEGDSHQLLMKKCLEKSQSQGLALESERELNNWFTEQLSQNLHVIFTIGETPTGASGNVISSPALFNRCVLSWMGDWSDSCLQEIASSELNKVPLDASPMEIVSGSTIDHKEGIVSYMIYVHRNSLETATTFPKEFLTLLNTFIELYKQKQVEYEENQRHVIIGLNKLRESMIQIDKLKADLATKEQALQVKSNEARLMLNTMLLDQNEAERKQEFSIETQAELEKQEIEIRKRREYVLNELRYVEPAVLEAQRGVQNIKKQHLTEIRSMINPPNGVKLTMESVCIILGYNVSNWKEVQSVVRSDDFIANIVNFDCETQLPPELREYMEQVYLSRDDFTFEAVHRASKACGPLLEWVRAQLAYSKILKDVGPLREEVRHLEKQTLKTKAQLIAIDEMIQELDKKIEECKNGYSELIRESERIRIDSDVVKQKLDRSVKLIKNLETERNRWKKSIVSFEKQNSQLVGNVLLCASYLTYASKFDEKRRELLMQDWSQQLKKLGIFFDSALSVSNFTFKREDIKHWVEIGSVNDETFTSNILAIEKNQNPILIDPNSTIVNLIQKNNSNRMITRTSFKNSNFMSNLENSLRFGGMLIVEDCEYYNPILDNLFRSGVQKLGGRMVIKLEEQMVDYNPSFKLIMCTKRSTLELSDFVKARTTTVNFAVTSGNLENIALNIALKKSDPELESQRSELVFSKSDLVYRIENLEDDLLQSLNTTTENIVDDDKVLNTLEFLKKEGNELSEKLNNAESIILNVNQVREKYKELAYQTTKVFEILHVLENISTFYHISLSKFISIYKSVIESEDLDKIELLIASLYANAFEVVAPSLTKESSLILAVLLSIFLNIFKYGENYAKNIKMLLSGNFDEGNFLSDCSIVSEPELSFNDLVEQNLGNELLNQFSFLKEKYTSKSLVNHLITNVAAKDYNLGQLLTTNNKFIIISPQDYDATFKIMDCAIKDDKTSVVIAMGAKESTKLVDQQLEVATNSPVWLVIENVQMSPSWLIRLESLNFQLHKDSKLFLTCNETSIIPPTLIATSQVLHFANDRSFNNNFLETFKLIQSKYLKGAIHLHIFVLYTWFHRILMESGKYCPYTFSKKYDLNESDFICGVYIIDKILSDVTEDESLVQWKEITFMVCVIVYGGKIDEPKDQEYIKRLASSLFTKGSLDSDFKLVETLHLPEGNNIDNYIKWINELPDELSITWLGLDSSIKESLDEKMAENVIKQVSKLLELI
ncbi:DYN1 [Candida jiufengensis]|uniref:DYN1 n=1 Tax=Candida jiufengensis TaxID=497108 RepID=UPI0022243EDD|nr:DYN1 [Candida jiufengensis]KAI5952826.1 DYN1 [Candida jiufengensis]